AGKAESPAENPETPVDGSDFQRRIGAMETQLDAALQGQEPLF
ncbi:MAG: cell division protein ZapA, partial [Azospira oryzae]